MNNYDNWWEETRSAYLYGIMAANETNVLHKKLFLNLKSAAESQAAIWENKIKNDQHLSLTFKLDFRTRFIVRLLKLFGTERLHFILSAMKIRGMSIFRHYHSEHKHLSLSSASNLRAAVFGVNDGLISNMSLILGMAGANSNQQMVLLAGLAGLLAGACSMGAGEYISVRSQREVFEYQIAIEKKELEEYPKEEIEELSLIYQARGMPVQEAKQIAGLMISNPDIGLNTLAREELGLNPDDLVSPFGAMLASFVSFAIGATIPLLPFLFHLNLQQTLTISMITAASALFLIGTILSLFNNRNALWQGIRMLLIGTAAGVLTFIIGKYVGVMV
jgi:VIT1/CCC1 family predicted Fe2+/Mn2+ transporter